MNQPRGDSDTSFFSYISLREHSTEFSREEMQPEQAKRSADKRRKGGLLSLATSWGSLMHGIRLRPVQSIHLSSRLDLPLSQELVLLSDSLPVGVTSLGSSVDELELDLFEVVSGSHGPESVSEGDDPLSGTGDTSLEHDKVVLDIGVSRPTTERVDVLFGNVKVGGSVLWVGT
jgi:hypothetical protein